MRLAPWMSIFPGLSLLLLVADESQFINGAVLTAVSPSFYVMAAGRLLFGLGAESLIVAITTAIAKWFRGKELSFAFGVNLTIDGSGKITAARVSLISRRIYGAEQPHPGDHARFAGLCDAGRVGAS